MLNIKKFGNELKELGFNFYSGVPCSFLKNLINYALNDCEYIMATNEGDAVAICAGAYLGGRKTVFLCQNSGLTNAVSPLTSLNYPFRIPVLGFVSLRGEEGLNDEPQHELMGRITERLLEDMEIKWGYLSDNEAEALQQLKMANEVIECGKSFFFVVKKDTFTKEELVKKSTTIVNEYISTIIEKQRVDGLPKREQVLNKLINHADQDTCFMATTGYTGRELYEIKDIPNNFYMVGSMGCISSLALGLAKAKPDKKVIAIDGDGALLMRMGALCVNGYYNPENLFHILLDNNIHESTGGQQTVAENVNFIKLAASVGYKNTVYIHDLYELEEYFLDWKRKGGLTFAYIKIAKGVKENLGRPKVKPYEVKERFMKFISGGIYA
ncbi:phosphonopyruvate decarboxylase [Aneurinibacillus migulanus]|uniref:Phosphonopyruvate decarboxylase n=1 Tax=Aneurinibacillus migulanus TaxID=47500 RepID=A0A0D1XZG2_ANEMI|nr:phosphonopyruvate decarboxylase [Aneurinibacillus migulanus]KIV52437.1 3-phosphonopyruvate decarboxylase [Aneurinibacillus migulanus]KON94613.1 3-phosphonopyruvate decarboxylase [Aneurinibacillus migulanus]MED0892661.1 phosphonopyruvate decarboxylase [Aneurinibacillus migulanus]MED1614302.1 phosphonopyruvate decarboxylase [Aneurinibacillus migulanus]SDI47981.1 phosphonopyruvate decarboxylase [Aneurinibacillus migulanus]